MLLYGCLRCDRGTEQEKECSYMDVRCDRGTEQEKECSYMDVRDVTEALSRRKSAPIWM